MYKYIDLGWHVLEFQNKYDILNQKPSTHSSLWEMIRSVWKPLDYYCIFTPILELMSKF